MSPFPDEWIKRNEEKQGQLDEENKSRINVDPTLASFIAALNF